MAICQHFYAGNKDEALIEDGTKEHHRQIQRHTETYTYTKEHHKQRQRQTQRSIINRDRDKDRYKGAS